MKVLTNASDIRSALRELEPSSVAVAYVGMDWKKYVSPKHLREIVLSPTLGTNPKAVEDMMRELGEKNVYFLDDLHSKFYIGRDAALLGSCNLSNNGMSDSGLCEAAVLLSDVDSWNQLRAQLEQYKQAAKEMYPTGEFKLARLRKLKQQQDRYEWYVKPKIAKQASPHVADYDSALDRIHICWYGPQEMEPNPDAIKGALVEAASMKDPYAYFVDNMAFAEGDDIRSGDWILTWGCKEDGFPRGNGGMHWIQAHHVIPNGFKDKEYPLLAGQAKANFIAPVAPPFLLDDATKSLIRKLLASGKFPQMLSIDESIWKQGPADKVTPAFLAELRKEAKKLRVGKKA